MCSIPLHSRDVQHARATRQDKASVFRRRKDRSEYARLLEEVGDFLCASRFARLAGKIEARAR